MAEAMSNSNHLHAHMHPTTCVLRTVRTAWTAWTAGLRGLPLPLQQLTPHGLSILQLTQTLTQTTVTSILTAAATDSRQAFCSTAASKFQPSVATTLHCDASTVLSVHYDTLLHHILAHKTFPLTHLLVPVARTCMCSTIISRDSCWFCGSRKVHLCACLSNRIHNITFPWAIFA